MTAPQQPESQTPAAPARAAGAKGPGELMVQLKDVKLNFGAKKILDGISLELYKGEILAVMGPSGTGKSTLIKIICGLLEPDSGEVIVNAETVGLAFQDGALFSSMSVADNLAMVLERTTDLDDEEIEARVLEALEMVGLDQDRDTMPSDLSGGMQKRVGIARALCIHPDVMLYDEPSAGLDPILAAKLEKDLREINETRDMATLLISHELPTIETMADRVMILYEGKIVYNGTKSDFKTTDQPYAQQFRSRRDSGPIEV